MTQEHYGVLELFRYEGWTGVVRTESLLLHEPELLGSLFGVDNRARFRPLFPERGLPDDVDLDFTRLVKQLTSLGVVISYSSWVTLEELRAIPWNESALEVDARIYKYQVNADGSETLVGQSHSYDEVGSVELAVEGAEVGVGEHVYRRVRPTRALLRDDGSGFPALLDLAEALASRYGEQNVRWSLFFAV